MNIGFTGTRYGMTYKQKREVLRFLEDREDLPEYKVHHGDCIGADAQFHDFAKIFGFKIIIHPPQDDSKRAFCGIHDNDPDIEILPAKAYLDRNRDIVYQSDFLIAAVEGPEEKSTRSGTWYTIRQAAKREVNTLIVYPDGTIDPKMYHGYLAHLLGCFD